MSLPPSVRRVGFKEQEAVTGQIKHKVQNLNFYGFKKANEFYAK